MRQWAWSTRVSGDWRRSEQSFERALELDPTLTDVSTNYSFAVLRPLGRSEEALRLLERRWRTIRSRSTSSERSRRSSSPAAATRRRSSDWSGFTRSIPSYRSSTQYLGRAMIFGGRVEEGLAMLDHEAARGRMSPHYRAHGLIRLGRRAGGRATGGGGGEGRSSYRETVIYAALGDLDRAFEALERTAAAEPHRLPLALTYPELASLRGDPRLAAFRQRLGLP